MDTREFREKLQIPLYEVFTDVDIKDMIDAGRQTVEGYLPTIKECVILYEASRRMGDKINTEYYKNKLLGKLGMVY